VRTYPEAILHLLTYAAFLDGRNSVVVRVEDRCAGCVGAADLDFTETGFAKLASTKNGRLHGVKWEWV
jgi:hypothetical protein